MRMIGRGGATMAMALGMLAAGRAEGAILLTATETSGGVVVAGGGTIDLTGLTKETGTFFKSAAINPSASAVGVGGDLGVSSVSVDLYSGITGPGRVGPGGLTNAQATSGDPFGVGLGANFEQILAVPLGYVGGARLTGSVTFDGATFASLGLVRGTYTFTLPRETFTFQVGPAAVPEPGSLAMVGVGLVGVGLGAVARRRRA